MNPVLLPDSARVARAPDAVWRDLDGRAAVISLDEGRIRTMNATATFVWSLLDERPRVDELLTRLIERFPATEREALARDLDVFLRDMVSRGLVQILAVGTALRTTNAMFRTTLDIAGLRIAFRAHGPFDVARFRYRFHPYEVTGGAEAPWHLVLWVDRMAKRLGASDAPYPALKAYRASEGTKLLRADLSLFLGNDARAEAYARGPARTPAFGFALDAGEADTPLRVLVTHGLLRSGTGALTHACGVRLDGLGGVLFIGPSGAGKTTTARLFAPHEVLSDDQTAIRRSGHALALESTPFVGMYGQTIAPCSAPLRAVVVLDRMRGGELVPLGRPAARSALLACLPIYNRSSEDALAALSLADEVSSHTRFFRGAPRLEEGAPGLRMRLERALREPKA